MQLSPVALFVYNRLWHTQQVVDALQKNELAKESELFIYSDAPQDSRTKNAVAEVRTYIKTIEGFKNVTVVERKNHLGLSESIITGVTEITNRYGRVIVLEDDMMTSPYFLKFMNEGLNTYEKEEKVISVCGYIYPLGKKYQDTLFLRIADCWGWATWKRSWDLFCADGQALYDNLKDKQLLERFNLDGVFNCTRMLKQQIQGKNDSWAIRWYASALLNDKLSLHPWKSLVRNIGFDYSGTHCGFMTGYDTGILEESVLVKKIPIVEDSSALENIRIFFKSKQRDIFGRVINKTVGFFRKRWYNKKLNL